MSIAIVHDRLCNRGGGEKVAVTIARALGGDIYTANYKPENTFEVQNSIRVTNPMPDMSWEKWYALVRMLDARSFSRLKELRDYDVLWMSGMWAPFAARNNPRNILYCHSPNRGIYDLGESLRKRQKFPWGQAFDLWRLFWKRMDQRAVSHVKRIVCNSRNVQKRIKKYWGRDAEILYPPVNLEDFYFERFGSFWLSVGRVMEEKRIDLQLDTFERLPKERLIIVGSAEYGTAYQKRMEERIRGMKNVEWKGRVGGKELSDLYANCKGTIQTALDEDFGYVPPESMASGKPCIAVNEGGFRESIEDGKTGILVDEPYVENLVRAIEDFKPSNFDPSYLQDYAQRFSEENFTRRVREITEEVMSEA